GEGARKSPAFVGRLRNKHKCKFSNIVTSPRPARRVMGDFLFPLGRRSAAAGHLHSTDAFFYSTEAFHRQPHSTNNHAAKE
ncbi:MAG: hypothetical protein ACC645_04150, partial [Pirellulales bacterium]